MAPYGECTTFRHLEGLEHTIANNQAMVGTGDRGLVRIVTKTTVAPDSELSGEELRSGCGELHPVRVTAVP